MCLFSVSPSGRGTSTDDGFGIAAAALETLLEDRRSTVLCATHFHDLTHFFDTPRAPPILHPVYSSEGSQRMSLEEARGDGQAGPDIHVADDAPEVPVSVAHGGRVINMHASAHVDEARQTITMLYEIRPGPALRSYGVNVAAAARFPLEILAHAKALEEQLIRLEEGRA
jgi:DNA mismatch repair ATPase MutS